MQMLEEWARKAEPLEDTTTKDSRAAGQQHYTELVVDILILPVEGNLELESGDTLMMEAVVGKAVA